MIWLLIDNSNDNNSIEKQINPSNNILFYRRVVMMDRSAANNELYKQC